MNPNNIISFSEDIEKEIMSKKSETFIKGTNKVDKRKP